MKLKKTIASLMAATMLMASAVSAGAVNLDTQIFDDVSQTSWYAKAVNEAFRHKLVYGVGSGLYDPNGTMTRAMTVQILYNYAGRPMTAWDKQYDDVEKDTWYYDAVKWAMANNVTNGTSPTTFSPEDNVTREQFATFLYNYIGKTDVSGSLNYPDAGDVSDWASESMLWATQKHVINGSIDNGIVTLNPQGFAARSEAAQMLTNYLDVTDGHSYKEIGGEAVSCTKDGHTDYECSICGKTKTEAVSATGHSYASEVTTAPTCGADGVKTYTCSNCNDTYTEVIPATGEHSYTSKITKAATCTEDGVKTFTCSTCGKSYTEAIPATGHDYSTAVVTKEATCTEDGIRTGTCKTCGKSYTETIPATGHNYTSRVTKAATCGVDGVKTYTCSNCNGTYTEVIPATGNHSYTSEVTTAATCTEDGVKTFTCSTCGKSYTEAIPATGHDYVTTTTKTATCQKEGTKTTACSHCGDVQSTETVPKTDHNYVETVIREANCDHGGISTFTCSLCNANYSTIFDGHDFQVQSYKVWGVVTDYVYANQCNNCFKYFDIGTTGTTTEAGHHLFECVGIGNGFSLVKMPIYTLADENTPSAKEITIETGWKCSKCGATTRRNGYYD